MILTSSQELEELNKKLEKMLDEVRWGYEWDTIIAFDELLPFMQEVYQIGVEQGASKILNEIILLRSPYIYDDYSSLNQQEQKIWLEYSKVESDFINKKLKALSTSNR